MRIKIARLSVQDKQGQKGPYRLYQLLNEFDQKWYSAFEKRGYTDQFRTGYEFDADVLTRNVNGKDFHNIQWPRQGGGGYPSSSQGGAPAPSGGLGSESVRLTEILRRISSIERNVETLLSIAESQLPGGLPPTEGLPTGEPPAHDDGDFPPQGDDVPF